MSDGARALLRRLLIGGLLVAAAGMLVYSASIKGEPTEPALVDSAVERLIPADDTPAAIRQSEIGIDLATGWDADLVINGVPIPQDEERNDVAQSQIYFAPGEGKAIEAIPPGRVEVTAVIWKPIAGQSRDSGSRTVSWSFRVA